MVSKATVTELIKNIAGVIHENRQFLTDLDAAIGDGDHGINMSRGFDAVVGKLPAAEGKDIGFLLKTVGMTLVSTVGGASGPLYGTAFMKMGALLGGKEELSDEDIIAALKEAVGGNQAARPRGAGRKDHARRPGARPGRAGSGLCCRYAPQGCLGQSCGRCGGGH